MYKAGLIIRSDTHEVVEKAGHTLEFLTPYSSELNPIERNGHQQKVSDENLITTQMSFLFT